MRANLKVILAAMSAAALLASPVMAKTLRHRHSAPPTTYVPADARGSAVPYASYGLANEGGPYTPSIAIPRYGYSRDFHVGPGR